MGMIISPCNQGPANYHVIIIIIIYEIEVWECWISIMGGAGTAFPSVQWHFNHGMLNHMSNTKQLSDSLQYFLPADNKQVHRR